MLEYFCVFNVLEKFILNLWCIWVSETNEENHDMTSTPPPPEVDIPNSDTEIPVQVEQITEDNNLTGTGTPSKHTTNTPSVKEKSPIIAKNNAKQILDKRKNNDEEDESTIGLCETCHSSEKRVLRST